MVSNLNQLLGGYLKLSLIIYSSSSLWERFHGHHLTLVHFPKNEMQMCIIIQKLINNRQSEFELKKFAENLTKHIPFKYMFPLNPELFLLLFLIFGKKSTVSVLIPFWFHSIVIYDLIFFVCKYVSN